MAVFKMIVASMVAKRRAIENRLLILAKTEICG
jgi:hypothetical protein